MKRALAVVAMAVAMSGCASMPDFQSAPGPVDLSWIQRGMQLADKYWPEWRSQIEDEFNPIGMPQPVPGTVQIARTWLNGAAPGGREMNLTADGVSLDQFKAWIDATKAAGANTVNLYLFNIKDGQPVPTTIYESGGYSGAVSVKRVGLITAKAEYAYAQGMMVNFWIFSDDGGYPVKDVPAMSQMIRDLKTHLDAPISKASYIVICLEANEVLGAGGRPYLDAYAKLVKELWPDVSTGNHMTSGEYGWSMECPYIDVHFHQVHPGKSVAACVSELKSVVSKATKPVIACEFDLHGDSAVAKEKAKGALAAGCIGVHSGIPAQIPQPTTQAHIVTRIDKWYGGETLSKATVDTRFQLTVSRDGKTWSAAPSDWPIKDGELNVMVCAAYQKDSQWVGGKFEWNRPKPSPRDWKNIKDGYNGWIAPPAGTEMVVWAASVDGKRVSTEATAVYE